MSRISNLSPIYPTASKMNKCLGGDEMCVKGQYCEIKLSDADPDAYCANEPRGTNKFHNF